MRSRHAGGSSLSRQQADPRSRSPVGEKDTSFGMPDSAPFDKLTDARGVTAVLRRGFFDREANRGFGWDKVWNQHKITNTNAVSYMVRNPNGGSAQGTKRVYFAYANRVECGVINCTVREVVRTRTVVEFKYFPTYYGYSVGGQPGVLTAYCDNYNPECPS